MNNEISVLEQERKQVYNKTVRYLRFANILYIIALILVILAIIFNGNQKLLLTFLFDSLLVFLLGVFLANIGYRNKKKINDGFKDKVVKKLLTTFYDDVIYDEKGSMNLETFIPSNIMRRPDRVKQEDYVSARYNQTLFTSVDVLLEGKRSYPNKNGQYTFYPYFKGRLIILKRKTTIEGNVKIVEIRKDSYLANPKSFETIEVESMEFNNKFQVDTDNKEAAFKLLTHERILNILKIEKMFSGAISFTFSKNLVFIAINSYTNFFEINYKHKISLEENSFYAKEASIFKNIIELLD